MCVYHVCDWFLRKPDGNVSSAETEVIGGCEMLGVVSKLISCHFSLFSSFRFFQGRLAVYVAVLELDLYAHKAGLNLKRFVCL